MPKRYQQYNFNIPGKKKSRNFQHPASLEFIAKTNTSLIPEAT